MTATVVVSIHHTLIGAILYSSKSLAINKPPSFSGDNPLYILNNSYTMEIQFANSNHHFQLNVRNLYKGSNIYKQLLLTTLNICVFLNARPTPRHCIYFVYFCPKLIKKLSRWFRSACLKCSPCTGSRDRASSSP